MRGVLERIRQRVREFPDRVAHCGGGAAMTYRELWGRAEALAAALEQRHARPGAPVGIRGHKEPEMIVGFLGAVLSGRGYIPIDVSMPETRVASIVATAGPAAVFTAGEIAQITAGWQSGAERSMPTPRADDPFYIIFTSGSTGDPKGVVITHGCLDSFVEWMTAEQAFTVGGEVFLNQAPYSFDLSVMDLYLSLTTGGTLVSLTREDVANPREMYAKLRTAGITTWVSTPSFAQMCLVERSFGPEMLPALRRFLFCGEALAHKTATALLSRFPSTAVWNTYGPTEATVATTSVLVDAALLAQHDPLPIGYEMPGTAVVIRQADGAPSPAGESGEIIIIGPNVSTGYLGRPDLTGRSFFMEAGRRGYRTGDRGYEKDGLLFFQGRMDFQIKLHGYRIELGDVEAHLRDLAGVVDAVVLPVERRGAVDSLAAFVLMREEVAGEENFPKAQALREALKSRVPEYMLPRKIEFLEAFPLTANGKADRKALAARLQ